MIVLIILIFLLLLTLPLLGAAVYYKRHDSEILNINQQKIKDPRYFGRTFARLIEERPYDSASKTVELSKLEEYVDADLTRDYPKLVDKLVIARETDFQTSEVEEFSKEIYAGGSLILQGHEGLNLRAAYSKKDMLIGPNTIISRWLDTDGTLAIYDNCDLGISVSSDIAARVGRNCKFRRIYAPQVEIGYYPGEEGSTREGDIRKYNLQKEKRVKRISGQIDDEWIDEEGSVNWSLVSDRTLRVPEGLIIKGDIKSQKDFILLPGSLVAGNVFAEGDIYLEKDTRVLGNVFSQENIYFQEGAQAGEKNRISSVIARGKIVFEGRNRVYGFISCEEQGRTGEVKRDRDLAGSGELKFLEKPLKRKRIEIENLQEYQSIDREGFRYFEELEEVILPQGAKEIAKSMFFACSSLRKVVLPKTLEYIGAYGFADCKKLRDISLGECRDLETIGCSAFENCESLERLEVPSSVRRIKGAAFTRCKSLKEVYLGDDSELRELGDHSFRGCELLEEIRLPRKVKKIGVSSFRDCTSLKKIILPAACRDEPGIRELSREKLEFYGPDLEEEES